MSTFSGLNTAYRGLVAARQGIDVVGQNIANANSDGYTRQRVTTSPVPAAGTVGLFRGGIRAGEGVSVDGIARLGDAYLDARVRSSASVAGHWGARAEALTDLEATLNEPGTNGLSAQLSKFWSAWADVSNDAGDAAPANVLLEESSILAARISSGYADVDAQWSGLRLKADSMAAEINDAASKVADLNAAIRSTLAGGGSANELLDQRSVLTTRIAALAGGSTRPLADGTVEVLVGGNSIVTGDAFRPVKLTGSYLMAGASASPPSLEWVDRAGSAIPLEGGELAGVVSMLAPADGSGTGGSIAEAAASYNAFAADLVAQVNAAHRTGSTRAGVTGVDFFAVTAGVPTAQGITVLPTSVDGIAAGAPGAGGFDGSVADLIAQLGVGADSPSTVWAKIVTGIGIATRSNVQQSRVADLAATSAVRTQLATSSVDMDEENVNLLTFQVAYQGAARVLTAVDEMLDVLINRTGLVGR